MGSYQTNEAFRHGSGHLTGVLISNLGTPDAPTPAALRRYLKEFLSDPRVVEFPRWLWWLVLNGVILNVRPRRSAEVYAQIWTEQGSPLLAIARQQHAALQRDLERRYGGAVKVALGMRYGTPSLAGALRELRAAGARRILLLPLYPQYSASTTASTLDAVAAELATWRWVPELHFINHYHDDPAYITAIANSIREHWQDNGRPQRLMFSFHGTPKRMHLAGDPYFCQCHKTARLVVEQLGLAERDWQLCFQSRFGKAEWLQPYTDRTLEAWGREGLDHVDVICPGFSADCLETLEEMNIQNRELFLASGGRRYSYIPALNDRHDHIEALGSLIARHLHGWEIDAADVREDPASRERALARGARD